MKKHPKYILYIDRAGKVIQIRKCLFDSQSIDMLVEFIDKSLKWVCGENLNYKEITEEEYNIAIVIES